MAQSVLMVYEYLDSLKESNYWQQYIDFYQKFWDGPATPQSSWWGREYTEFRQSLSNQLGLDEKYLKDCFFLKDNDEKYYVCPIGMDVKNLNILAAENGIPYEWFLLFANSEKNYFYTHTGFGAIHHDAIYYSTKIQKCIERIEKAESIISGALSGIDQNLKNYESLKKLEMIKEGIFNIKNWISGFDGNGIIILNYGEISACIDQNLLKKENSVGNLWDIIEHIEKGELEKADSELRKLDIKWIDISSNASGSFETQTLQ